ncbi:hypothetical protein BLNAU_20161 [Blattamonas nauphoetae]|uniref:Uncharacterized protein n=1 Tax=Blattamonas nauphoetae TaxID=2049346 RepID=A0ABQ9WZH2_9EUKA|nr:hypothetical protein BLNAU_20161 [Blattamonas nauphoetae]
MFVSPSARATIEDRISDHWFTRNIHPHFFKPAFSVVQNTIPRPRGRVVSLDGSGRSVSIDGDDPIARSPIALPQLAAAPPPAIHVRSDTKFISLPPLPPRARLCVTTLQDPFLSFSRFLNHRSVLLNRWNIEERPEIEKWKQRRRQARPKGEWIGTSLHQPTNQSAPRLFRI